MINRGWAMNQGSLTYPKQKLNWQDKALIGLSMLANAYVVFNWYLMSLHGVSPLVDGIFAVCAGLALDWGVMRSATGTLKRGDRWWKGWAFWTPFIGFLSSSLIAYVTYATTWVDPDAAVHMVIPLFVWAASQYVASNQHQDIEVWINAAAKREIDRLTEAMRDSTIQLAAALGYQQELKRELTQVRAQQADVDRQRGDDQARLTEALAMIDTLKQRHQLELEQQRRSHDDALKGMAVELERVKARPAVQITGAGKPAIRAILDSYPELIGDTNRIIELLGIDLGDERAVKTARTQISQVRAERGNLAA